MLVGDNQQETTVGWFTAILEGEGSFRNNKSHKMQVRISNTDTDIINRCEQFLRSRHIYFSTYENRRKGVKPIYDISIWNESRSIFNWSQELYNVVEPCLECRRDEYQSILGSSQSIREPSVDLDWLTGIFESEGYFSLILDNRGYAQLSCGVCNTNQRIISKILLNLCSIWCPYYIQNKGKYRKQDYYKEAKAITIYGLKRCDRFLRLMKGRWLASRNIKRTELMREFISSRLAVSPYEKLTARQLQIIQIMRDLNR